MVRVENAGIPGAAPALTSTQATELVNLLNGVSTVYVRPSSAVFTAAPKYNAAPVANDDLANKAYVDAQVAAGLPNTGTAGTYTKVTTDAQGRVTLGTTLSESDIPNLTSAGKVDGGAINAGTIGGSAAINTTGNIVTGGTVSANIVSGNQVRVYNGSNYIPLQAPVLGGNTTYTLPAADGTGGYVLSTNGSGTLSWIAPTTGSVTSVGATAPIASSGGQTPTISISQANTTTDGYLSSADWNTFNNKQNAFGSQTARTVYAAPQGANGAPSFRLLNISDVRSTVAGDFLTGGACTSGQALTYNSVSDNISCSTIVPTIANTANLANGRVWIGDGTGKAQEQTISGDLAIDNAGVAAIQTGVITNTDINASANIEATKLGTGVVDNTELNYLNGVTSAIQTQLDGKLNLSGGTMTGAINMGNQNITNAGNVEINTQRNLLLGRYTNAQETTLLGTLVAGDKGRTWFNTDANQIKYWDGSSVQVLGAVGGAVILVGPQRPRQLGSV